MSVRKNLEKEQLPESSIAVSVPGDVAVLTQKEIIEHLFYKGNTLLTATDGALETARDTQNLLAYFFRW